MLQYSGVGRKNFRMSYFFLVSVDFIFVSKKVLFEMFWKLHHVYIKLLKDQGELIPHGVSPFKQIISCVIICLFFN